MKAKSDKLAASRRGTKTKAAPQSSAKIRKPTVRLPAKARRAQILDKAIDFFSKNGLTA